MKKKKVIGTLLLGIVLSLQGCTNQKGNATTTVVATSAEIPTTQEPTTQEPTTQEPTTEVAKTPLQRQAEAYLDVCNQYSKDYGEFKSVESEEEGGFYLFGTPIVKLMDFDGDGTQELFVCYQKYKEDFEYSDEGKFAIWSWDGKKAEKKLADISYTTDQDGGEYVSFIDTGKSIIPYTTNTLDYSFFEFKNNEFSSMLTAMISIEPDEPSLLNGKNAQADSVSSACEEVMAKGKAWDCQIARLSAKQVKVIKKETKDTLSLLKKAAKGEAKDFSKVAWVLGDENPNEDIYLSFHDAQTSTEEEMKQAYVEVMNQYYSENGGDSQFFVCDIDGNGDKELCLTTDWGNLLIYNYDGEIHDYAVNDGVGTAAEYVLTSKGLFCSGGYGTGASGYYIFNRKNDSFAVVEQGDCDAFFGEPECTINDESLSYDDYEATLQKYSNSGESFTPEGYNSSNALSLLEEKL